MGQVDAIVAGAGIWGCTVARVLAEKGRKVLVLEKRPHVGGNVRCETDPETGIEVHTYGSHIFHTHIDRVWDFVRRFVEFNGYQHKVLARHAGKTYFLPLGLALVNQFYGLDLKPSELPDFIAAEAGRGMRPCVPANFEEQAIAFIGKPLYDAFIREYTRKQWGTDPRNLGADIIKRLPVRASYDINYYTDYRQGIPLTGYNSLFDRILDHPNISVECNVDWLEWRKSFGTTHQAPSTNLLLRSDRRAVRIQVRSAPLALAPLRAGTPAVGGLSGDERGQLHGRRRAVHAHPRVQALPSGGCCRHGGAVHDHLLRVSAAVEARRRAVLSGGHARVAGAPCTLHCRGREGAGAGRRRTVGRVQVLRHGPFNRPCARDCAGVLKEGRS